LGTEHTQSLPASFYLGSKPAWFGSVRNPPIGPDVTGALTWQDTPNKNLPRFAYKCNGRDRCGAGSLAASMPVDVCLLVRNLTQSPTGLTATVN